MCKHEKPVHPSPRRLADWLGVAGTPKVHSLIDKVYARENVAVAWERVRANRGSGGIDGQSLQAFAQVAEAQLARLHQELKDGTYRPQPVREVRIPKGGQPGKYRRLGIPTVYDRVCQQAVLNRLEPVFEPVFDAASFGYRRGRAPQGALRKVWREITQGAEWIVDADLQDFFGSVDHAKLVTLVAQRIADGRVLRLLEAMLTAERSRAGTLVPTDRGTPQGGVVSPLLSNILLTPFDREMRRKGYQLTRYADDWVITCRTRTEAEAALRAARRVLTALGVQLHAQKTRIVHVRYGFDFLGYTLKQGWRTPRYAARAQGRRVLRPGALYAIPAKKAVQRFKDEVRRRTGRRSSLRTRELIQQLNPVLLGWGHYFKRAAVRTLFHRLDGWIVRRLWAHRGKRWRCQGWRVLPHRVLYRQLGLVNLFGLIPSEGVLRHATS
jgi:RNA-directed DNA polymerase